jgi:hypothetical protein
MKRFIKRMKYFESGGVKRDKVKKIKPGKMEKQGSRKRKR